MCNAFANLALPWLEFFRLVATSLFVGLAIKMMDDYLDQELDASLGKPNLALILRRGILPYALFAMSLGLYFYPTWGLGFFCASYTLGMGHSMDEFLPTGLQAWHEAGAATILAFLFLGWRLTLVCFALMAIFQFIDDWFDYQEDAKGGGRNNWVHYCGHLHSAIISLLLCGWALVLAPLPTCAGLIGFIGVNWINQALVRLKRS